MDPIHALLTALCRAIERSRQDGDLFAFLELAFSEAAPLLHLSAAGLSQNSQKGSYWQRVWKDQSLVQSGAVATVLVTCGEAQWGSLWVEKSPEAGPWTGPERDFLAGVALLAGGLLEGCSPFDAEVASRQALSRKWVEVQEAERRKIARELHDEAAQALSSLLIGLKLVEKEATLSGVDLSQLRELRSMTVEIMNGLHRLAVELRPPTLDHLGLISALEQLIEKEQRESGLEVQFETIGLDESSLAADVKTALYRIVQEALSNVCRHAGVVQAALLLEARQHAIVLVIEDHGRGFDTQVALTSGRLGLVGMRERAAMLGGKLTIESEPGEGTTLFIEVPNEISHHCG